MKRWLLVMIISLVCLLTAVSAFAYDDNTAGVENTPDDVRSILTSRWPEWEITGWVNPAGLRSSSACAFAAIHKDRSNTLVAFGYKDGHWVYKWSNAGALSQRAYGMQLLEGTDGGKSQARFVIRELTSPTTETVWTQSRSGQPFLLTSYIVHDTDSSILETLTVNAENIQYQGWRTEERKVSFRGTTQRDLRYFSWSAYPKTPDELRTGLTAAPEIPSGDLEALDIKFTGGKRYDVFSAPDRSSLRGGNGKARVSTNGWIQVFGTENDWALIQYSIDASHYRFGYISSKALPKKANVPALSFNAVDAWTTTAVSLTDDPLYSGSELLFLQEGLHVTWLATLGEWAYVEVSSGDWARGFVPLSSVTTSQEIDMENNPSEGGEIVYDGVVTVFHDDRIEFELHIAESGPLASSEVSQIRVTDTFGDSVLAILSPDSYGTYYGNCSLGGDVTSITLTAVDDAGTAYSQIVRIEW